MGSLVFSPNPISVPGILPKPTLGPTVGVIMVILNTKKTLQLGSEVKGNQHSGPNVELDKNKVPTFWSRFK